jgi:hypothetical protein
MRRDNGRVRGRLLVHARILTQGPPEGLGAVSDSKNESQKSKSRSCFQPRLLFLVRVDED